jgi:hypothetical protein
MTKLSDVMGTLSLITGIIVVLGIIGLILYISGHYCLVKFKFLRPKTKGHSEGIIKTQDRGFGDIGLYASERRN